MVSNTYTFTSKIKTNKENMATININGGVYSGNNISVINGKIIVDGVNVTPGDSKHIKIEVTGNIDKLTVDACNEISINGNVGTVKTMSGNVDVTGDIAGDIKTLSGNVDCDDVSGNVKTMSGNIRRA